MQHRLDLEYSDYNISGLHFVLTCGACPEQYDVFTEDNTQVGYIRLRYGNISVSYPDVGGKSIFYHSFVEGNIGMFPNEKTREIFLRKIAKKIRLQIRKERNESVNST